MPGQNLQKLQMGEIKAILKGYQMSQAGDKGTLVHRVKLKERCVALGLVGDDDPCTLNAGGLRKKAAQCGISPIGTQDEMLAELVAFLESNKGSSTSGNTTNNAPTNSSSMGIISGETASIGGSTSDPVATAKEVLRLNEYDDYEGIMNLGNAPSQPRLTASTPHALLRKAYLKLSLSIHPDKLLSKFAQATTAFQALVKAFEYITSPVVTDAEVSSAKKAGKKVVAISRSNDGCVRTRVKCPRCRQVWSEGTLDGNPDYVYNFLMQGLKQYTCSTCLCEFGCMTAVHICPYCRGSFEYSPQDYHRKIKCGNANCSKEFGFMMFHASDNVINELKRTLKEDQEKRTKARQSKLRRQQRAEANSQSVRGSSLSPAAQAEEAFCLGLTELCPRCGHHGLVDIRVDTAADTVLPPSRLAGHKSSSGASGTGSSSSSRSSENGTVYEMRKAHLATCTDKKSHADYAKSKAIEAKKEKLKDERTQGQEEAQQLATWEFFGADTAQLWLLEDNNLRKKAKEYGIADCTGDKLDLIEKIVEFKAGGEKLKAIKGVNMKRSAETIDLTCDGDAATSTALVSKRRKRMTSASLPSNLHAKSLEELVAICIAHGFRPKNPGSKEDVINEIEDEIVG